MTRTQAFILTLAGITAWTIVLFCIVVLMTSCGAPAAEIPEALPDLTLRLPSDPVLSAAFTAAAERWVAASGMLVHFSDDGAPVYWGKPEGPNSDTTCAGTYIAETCSQQGCSRHYVSRVVVDPSPPAGCVDAAHAALHELGHIISVGSAEHSRSGIFRDGPRDTDRIDEASLEAVCSVDPCSRFNPEY